MAQTEAKLSLLLKSAGSSLQSFWTDISCTHTELCFHHFRGHYYDLHSFPGVLPEHKPVLSLKP